MPTIDFVQTTTDNDKDISILEEDNSQIYAHLDDVLVRMIDNQEAAIFKSKQDFNKNKEKISQYIKYAENWQVVSVICSHTAMACDVLLIVAMIAFILKYHKNVMLTTFLQMNTKNTGIQSIKDLHFRNCESARYQYADLDLLTTFDSNIGNSRLAHWKIWIHTLIILGLYIGNSELTHLHS